MTLATSWSRYVDLEVELGIGATDPAGGVAGVWNASKWDRPLTGTWAGIEPVWFVVDPCLVLDVNTTRGRDRWTDRFTTSTATVGVDDATGVFSWDAATDPETLALRPGRGLRITARSVASGVVYPVWRGFVEAIGDDFSPGSHPVARLGAEDGLAMMQRVNLPEQSPVGAGERSDQRVARLLDLGEWPKEWRDLEHGATTVQATNLARAIGDDLGITADSEGGGIYVGKDGNVVFRNRDWLRVAPESTTVQAIVGPHDDAATVPVVCPSGYVLVRTGADIVNDVQVARAGGTVQRFTNEASIGEYRRRTYNRNDYICESDAQVAVLGNRILNARAAGQVRIPKLTITPTDATSFEFVLAVDFGWRLEVRYAVGAESWSRVVHVQGVAHRVTPSSWSTELRVDDVYATSADSWNGSRGWDRALWSEVA